ncbi:MAG: hypothetical protein JWQ80_1117 [Massilia sp.]|nr:hypothetical protein [Massilia sp.]
MNFLSFSRIAASCIASLMGFWKKVGAERRAAQDGLTQEPSKKIHSSTFVHVGASASDYSGNWTKMYDLVVRNFVRSEALKQAHVPEWINLSLTQARFEEVANATIARAPTPLAVREELISSYMSASGENYSRSSDFVDLVSSVLVAGLLSGVKDDALSAQLQISVMALNRRFDSFDEQLKAKEIPEPGWSFDEACKANKSWLLNAFSNRSKARMRLGQALCPADTSDTVSPISRSALTDSFDRLLVNSPPGGVIAVTGNEGNGKSWLVAQAWLTWTVKPLTLFLTAEDFSEKSFDPVALLARKICDQTDRQGDKDHESFWVKQLRVWRRSESPNPFRFLVVIDGLNQRPGQEWPRVIDTLGDELERIGSKLIITSRKRYFDELIKPPLVSPYRELPIPEWTEAERDGLLAVRSIAPGRLDPKVAASLCNPRLLNVALRLLDGAQLLAMEELSISLLLFEHIRASRHESYGQPVVQFTSTLQNHAKQMLQRLNSEQLDDLKIFEGDLGAVAESRFFTPLADDFTKYRIHEEGLGLALGLAIIDDLRAALRNNRDLNDVLARLIDPISALDETSEAILAALTVACVTEEVPQIGTAILIAFASAQNPDERSFSSFVALVRAKPPVFVEAAQFLALRDGTAVNFDWIEQALQLTKTDFRVWKHLATGIERWLRHVSFNVEWQIFPSEKNADEIAEQLTLAQTKLEDTLAGLSVEERNIFGTLIHTAARDVSVLGRLALTLLAGLPLAPFADCFVSWNFARCLNGNRQSPIQDFRHLVRFNNKDWLATRLALLQASQGLQDGASSRVGKWATVGLLDATGHPDDARVAQKLFDDLRPGHPTYSGWRRNEHYCLTDPCNPNNGEPPNVEKTALEYASVDVKALFQDMAQGERDLFFNDARPAVARYYPSQAVEKHRALIEDLFVRTGLPLRQIVFGLLDHSALFTHEQACRLLRRVCGSHADIAARDSLGDDASIWTLFQLEIAFPGLDAHAQLEALLQVRAGSNISGNLIELIKPLDRMSFETALKREINGSDDIRIFTVLLFSPFAKQQLPETVRECLPVLLQSNSTIVRAFTLHIIARSEDEFALNMALKCSVNRPVQGCRPSELESWNFSAVVFAAAKKGLAWEALAGKMNLRHIACLARDLGADAARHFADVLDELITRSLNLDVETKSLEIEITLHPSAHSQPNVFSLREPKPRQTSLTEFMQHGNEVDDEFDERQTRLKTAFSAFLAEIADKNADNLLNDFLLDEFPSSSQVDPARLERWCDLLLALPEGAKLTAVRNLALHLARAISGHNGSIATKIFKKFDAVRPIARNVFGRTGFELGAMAVWSACDGLEINKLRDQRLDRAGNNDELAREVWTALWNDKHELVRCYVDARLSSAWPAAQARAILVAGLMGQNEHSREVLQRFRDTPGLLGESAGVASALYERHGWTEHWYNIMRNATSAEEFWSGAVLFLVVADGRVDAPSNFKGTSGAVFRQYWPGTRRQLNSRFDKLRDKWKKDLFNEEAPKAVFLNTAE